MDEEVVIRTVVGCCVWPLGWWAWIWRTTSCLKPLELQWYSAGGTIGVAWDVHFHNVRDCRQDTIITIVTIVTILWPRKPVPLWRWRIWLVVAAAEEWPWRLTWNFNSIKIIMAYTIWGVEIVNCSGRCESYVTGKYDDRGFKELSGLYFQGRLNLRLDT